jgi:hypothetical protein
VARRFLHAMKTDFRSVPPERTEAAPYYFRYIDRVSSGDIVDTLGSQLEETTALLRTIDEARSLTRYAPEKWSIRQVLNHLNDTERLFAFRAFWFARGFDSALPSFDQDIASGEAAADTRSWNSHVAEFVNLRAATLDLFRDLPAAAWSRRGVASDNPFTVRAIAWITAGHTIHHIGILEERYLRRS